MKAESTAHMRSFRGLWGTAGAKLDIRRPASDPCPPYVAVLGGSATHGKLVDVPYPALLEQRTGLPVVNLGVMHAGASLFSSQRWLLDAASSADLTIVQVTGAQNMSNRLYCVHPRRNDRFLTSSKALRVIFPEVDFAEVNFTGHLMSRLHQASPDRFAIVVEELRWAWVQRMRRIVRGFAGRVVLLWLSERSPDDASVSPDCTDPIFVTRRMLDELAPDVCDLVEVVAQRPDRAPGGLPFGCAPSDAPLHAAAADALAHRVGRLLPPKRKDPGRATGVLHAAADVSGQSFSISSGTAVKRSATSP